MYSLEDLQAIIDTCEQDDHEIWSGKSVCEVGQALCECEHDDWHVFQAWTWNMLILESQGDIDMLMSIAFLRGVQFGRKLEAARLG